MGDTTVQPKVFASDGALHSNDWGSSPHGQDYRSRLSAAGRSDILEYISSTLASRVQAVDEAFAQEHGLNRDRGLEGALRQAHKPIAKVGCAQVETVRASSYTGSGQSIAARAADVARAVSSRSSAAKAPAD
jgi:hypothetical protein